MMADRFRLQIAGYWMQVSGTLFAASDFCFLDSENGFNLIEEKSIKVSDIVGFISNNDEALLGLI